MTLEFLPTDLSPTALPARLKFTKSQEKRSRAQRTSFMREGRRAMVISRSEPFWYSLNSFSIMKFEKRPPPDQETTFRSKKFCKAKMIF
jgi:hypothetical protein